MGIVATIKTICTANSNGSSAAVRGAFHVKEEPMKEAQEGNSKKKPGGFIRGHGHSVGKGKKVIVWSDYI